jgi:hypothetical protein
MIPKHQNHTLHNLMAAAPCKLMVVYFADFWFVTEYATKCANLHFGCVTIKMTRKWGNERLSLHRLGNKIYILLINIYFMELDEWVGCVSQSSPNPPSR